MKNGFWLSFIGLMFAVLIFTSATGCITPSPSPPPVQRPSANLTGAHNDFGFNLTHQLVQSDAGKNIFISPTSISMALSMVYEGSNGSTRSEMAQVLGYDGLDLATVDAANRWSMYDISNKGDSVQLDIANSLWLDKDFTLKSDYTQAMDDSYQASIQSLDFKQASSADTINGWVSQKTNGKITQIVDSNALSQMRTILVNAVYFKGTWSTPFDPSQTSNRDFHLSDNTTIQTPMMQNQGQYKYTDNDQMQVVRLPYANGSVAMYIFLPNQNSTMTNIDQFTRDMNSDVWNQQLGNMTYLEGTVIMPKFNIDYSKDLIPSLKAMGMNKAFSTQPIKHQLNTQKILN